MNQTMTKINGEKLKLLLSEKAVNVSEFSVNLGYSKNYIASACQRGAIRKNIMWEIEERLGIPASEYEDRGEVFEATFDAPIKEATAEPKYQFTREELQEVIRIAVVMGIQDAQARIFNAVWGALNLYKKGQGNNNG